MFVTVPNLRDRIETVVATFTAYVIIKVWEELDVCRVTNHTHVDVMHSLLLEVQCYEYYTSLRPLY